MGIEESPPMLMRRQLEARPLMIRMHGVLHHFEQPISKNWLALQHEQSLYFIAHLAPQQVLYQVVAITQAEIECIEAVRVSAPPQLMALVTGQGVELHGGSNALLVHDGTVGGPAFYVALMHVV